MSAWLIVLLVILGIIIVGLIIWLIVWLISGTTKNTDYQVEVLNDSDQLLLLGAIGPTPVMPNENTWELYPGHSLTINIPSTWLNTAGNSNLIGPRFWVRTGCRYDVQTNKAQCETGDCNGPYNCSQYQLAGKIPTSLAEFCFECGGGLTYYDVSLVDGYSLSINIEPLDGTATNPNDPNDVFWCKTNLCNSGQDLRSICPPESTLRNSQLDSYIPGQSNNIIGCFSNCGFFEYPVAPSLDCDSTKDPKCAGWRQYCCQAPDFGKPCTSDTDCSNGGACWTGNNNPPSPTNPATCQCRAYYLNPPCPADVCTNPEAQPPPSTCTNCAKSSKGSTVISKSTFPNTRSPEPDSTNIGFANTSSENTSFSNTCSTKANSANTGSVNRDSVNTGERVSESFNISTSTSNVNFDNRCIHASIENNATTCTGCIGDDTVHSICPRAYSWPNDPQTYDCNAKHYRITISPGGTSVPITPSVPIFPKCNQLPSIFDYSKAKTDCANIPAFYGCAVKNTSQNPKWECNVDPPNVGCDGVICAWNY